jgi:hypothetical protein
MSVMPRFDSERLQRALDARALTVQGLARAAGISPTTAQTARSGGEISVRSQAAILRALSAIPELPHLDLLAGTAVQSNGIRAINDGSHQAGQPVGAKGNGGAQASTTA